MEKTRLVYKDDDGLKKVIIINRCFNPPKIEGHPIHREHPIYQEWKQKLGDDWFSDITDSWYNIGHPVGKDNQEELYHILNL